MQQYHESWYEGAPMHIPEDPAERGAWRHGVAPTMDPDLLMATVKFGGKRLGTKAWNIPIHRGRRQRQTLQPEPVVVVMPPRLPDNYTQAGAAPWTPPAAPQSSMSNTQKIRKFEQMLPGLGTRNYNLAACVDLASGSWQQEDSRKPFTFPGASKRRRKPQRSTDGATLYTHHRVQLKAEATCRKKIAKDARQARRRKKQADRAIIDERNGKTGVHLPLLMKGGDDHRAPQPSVKQQPTRQQRAVKTKSQTKSQTKSPPEGAETMSPAPGAKTKSPVEEEAEPESPAKEAKTESPAEEEAKTESTAEEEAKTESTAEEVKTESPAKEVKTESPAEEAKTESPAKEAGTKSPAKEVKTESPAKEAKTKTPAKEAKTESRAEEGAKTTSPEEAKTESPAKEAKTTSPAGEAKTQSLADDGDPEITIDLDDLDDD